MVTAALDRAGNGYSLIFITGQRLRVYTNIMNFGLGAIAGTELTGKTFFVLPINILLASLKTIRRVLYDKG